MRTLVTTLFCLTLLVAATGVAGAATISVPGDQPSIVAGMAAAVAGDTVLVDCGVYAEHDIMLKSGVTLLSETGGAYCAVIDAGGLGRVLLGTALNNQTLVKGFTLRGGDFGAPGAGIYLENSAALFENCIVTDNESAGAGGGIACVTNSSPIFERCTITWNRSGEDGGGIALYNSTPQFVDCMIGRNQAGGKGGGLFAEASAFTAQHCDVFENGADDVGGGIALDPASPATLDLVTVYGNHSATGGGGVAIDTSRPTFGSCTIAENSALGSGSGLHAVDAEETVFEQTIIAFNTISTGVSVIGTPPDFGCCDIYGNAGGDWVAPIDTQLGVNGNFRDNPEFCGVDSSGNYFLQTDSPCSPGGNGCGALIGSRIVDCGIIAVEPASWSAVKSFY